MCSLCYAVGVLCYATLYCMLRYVLHYLYSITLAMLYAYTEVWRILLIGPWLRRCSVFPDAHAYLLLLHHTGSAAVLDNP